MNTSPMQARSSKPSKRIRWRNQLVASDRFSAQTVNRMLSAVKRVMAEAATQKLLPHHLAALFKQVEGVKARADASKRQT